jgi:esterase/lipase
MNADPTSQPKPPILLLHGVFGKPSLLQPWTRFLESAGYVVHVPTLPGREPTNDAVLAGTGIEDCFEVALDAYDRIGEPAIVIGHSMGGLLTQKVAAAREPRAAVLLASIPPRDTVAAAAVAAAPVPRPAESPCGKAVSAIGQDYA